MDMMVKVLIRVGI